MKSWQNINLLFYLICVVYFLKIFLVYVFFFFFFFLLLFFCEYLVLNLLQSVQQNQNFKCVLNHFV